MKEQDTLGVLKDPLYKFKKKITEVINDADDYVTVDLQRSINAIDHVDIFELELWNDFISEVIHTPDETEMRQLYYHAIRERDKIFLNGCLVEGETNG